MVFSMNRACHGNSGIKVCSQYVVLPRFKNVRSISHFCYTLVKKSIESTSAFSFVSAAELTALRGGSSSSKRKMNEEEEDEDDEEDNEYEEEDEEEGQSLSAVQKRREFDLDAQFYEDDDKKWACVHPDELLPDRAIPRLAFLLDKRAFGSDEI